MEKSLYERIYDFIRQVPRGRVTTYGRVADAVGGCSARQVGYALAALPPENDVPWHRVVNREGRISVRSHGDISFGQKARLEREGIALGQRDRLNLDEYLWAPDGRFSYRLDMEEWPKNVAEARVVQEDLKARVVARDDGAVWERVAGVDASYRRGEKRMKAAVALLGWPDLELLDQAVAQIDTPFPYVPGYFSFREVPAVIEALERLSVRPDLIVCDGQGVAHPRRFGLACHLGVLTGIPTIGAAKSKLIGDHDPVGELRGDRAPLIHQGEIIGYVVRTRTGVRPLYVSVGHRIGLETAVETILHLTPRYRLPETTRQAHHLASLANFDERV